MADDASLQHESSAGRGPLREVARACAGLGCVAVGGPGAHVGLLESDLVERRRWLTPGEFTELFSVASVLPGPTSTQVVIGAGLLRGGAWGGVVALASWAAPAVVVLTTLALGLSWWERQGGGLEALGPHGTGSGDEDCARSNRLLGDPLCQRLDGIHEKTQARRLELPGRYRIRCEQPHDTGVMRLFQIFRRCQQRTQTIPCAPGECLPVIGVELV